ncbi:MAG TPA: tRNA (adenosine(37)-N6)-threonylcarbamoyltransferase complex dimerization subunit type 1 TsaB [Vicinamibacterales bacterium]|nr:tRNA (adenosine(37)-N6)-threonylcarbamoyltransferase complex dimerization subunit type 1 TsaB [Vicinamibacterales bacterium]
MLILSLDTTTRGGSVAVCDEDRVLALLRGDESRTHGERLPGELARALADAGITKHQIDLLAVATGPGAFTGLRIGLAAMQGLAMTLQKPVAGVSALDALVEQVAGEADVIVPWMDAQRGEVFAAVVDGACRRTIEPATAGRPEALLAAWQLHLDRRAIFTGDAVVRDAAMLTRAGWRARLPDPLAPHIAWLARRMALRDEAGPPHALTPIYVRKPDAEIERERRVRS